MEKNTLVKDFAFLRLDALVLGRSTSRLLDITLLRALALIMSTAYRGFSC
jgi:hypothetical protein